MRDENNTSEVLAALAAGIPAGLAEMGKDGMDQIDKAFDSGRDPMGAPWAPLAESTLRQKGHDTILVDTGDYRDSFEMNVTTSAGLGPTGGSGILEIASESDVAKWHEFGTSRMPARPVLQPTARWLAEQGTDRFEDHLQTAITAAVLR